MEQKGVAGAHAQQQRARPNCTMQCHAEGTTVQCMLQRACVMLLRRPAMDSSLACSSLSRRSRFVCASSIRLMDAMLVSEAAAMLRRR